MKQNIDRRFGTWRGLLRLLLAYVELASGRIERFRLRHPNRVRRVVFVCQGNICRSAFAAGVAYAAGLEVASVGLATTTGASPPESALRAARRQGVEIDTHRSCDWQDFTVLPGDLLLVMEIRQAHHVRRRIGRRNDVQLALLGMWCDPPVPHLHDPYSLSDGYFDSCFARVRQAVRRLLPVLPQAHRNTETWR